MSEITVGRIGELICCLRLEEIGIPNEIAHINGFDIAAHYNSKLIRVQVKARSVPDTRRKKIYMFTTSKGCKKKIALTRNECDVIGLVSIPEQQVIFMPVKTKVNVTARVRISEYKKKNIALITWNQAMQVLNYSD
tara:strand:- start:1447 stop:1854 length:408 start_codon:yes stop_codon:yes gene_type:complete